MSGLLHAIDTLTAPELEAYYEREFPDLSPYTRAAMAYYQKGYSNHYIVALLYERFHRPAAQDCTSDSEQTTDASPSSRT